MGNNNYSLIANRRLENDIEKELDFKSNKKEINKSKTSINKDEKNNNIKLNNFNPNFIEKEKNIKKISNLLNLIYDTNINNQFTKRTNHSIYERIFDVRDILDSDNTYYNKKSNEKIKQRLGKFMRNLTESNNINRYNRYNNDINAKNNKRQYYYKNNSYNDIKGVSKINNNNKIRKTFDSRSQYYEEIKNNLKKDVNEYYLISNNNKNNLNYTSELPNDISNKNLYENNNNKNNLCYKDNNNNFNQNQNNYNTIDYDNTNNNYNNVNNFKNSTNINPINNTNNNNNINIEFIQSNNSFQSNKNMLKNKNDNINNNMSDNNNIPLETSKIYKINNSINNYNSPVNKYEIKECDNFQITKEKDFIINLNNSKNDIINNKLNNSYINNEIKKIKIEENMPLTKSEIVYEKTNTVNFAIYKNKDKILNNKNNKNKNSRKKNININNYKEDISTDKKKYIHVFKVDIRDLRREEIFEKSKLNPSMRYNNLKMKNQNEEVKYYKPFRFNLNDDY